MSSTESNQQALPSRTRTTKLKLLFVVEGFTDIRFIDGLSKIADLTMLIPTVTYESSGLDKRIIDAGLSIQVIGIPGNRIAYQVRSLSYLLKNINQFDIVMAQEMLRGAASACLAGVIRHVPVVTYTALPPLEYFHCRKLRNQLGSLRYLAGSMLIRSLLHFSGTLNTCTIALGPYLMKVAGKYSSRVMLGHYYGVDTTLYHPITADQKVSLRQALNLPAEAFLILLVSRISHEKDPETVLLATSLARAQGLDARVINLGGGYQDFLELARTLRLDNYQEWVLGRPAMHPMRDLPDYYRASDCMALASLEEGLGMSPLESMACGVPAVCTSVGGMAHILPGYARLVGRRDAEGMAREFLSIAADPDSARQQALKGREYVEREWNRQYAFERLRDTLETIHANA